MDLYKEYNRIRRNLMRQAKYHNISITKIPTAKQLISQNSQSKITKSNIKTLTTQKQSLQTIIKSTLKTKIKDIKIKTTVPKPKEAKVPRKSKTKKSKSTGGVRGRKPDYEKYYKKYGTAYTEVTSTGEIIDRYTGEEITNALFASSEEIGKYIYDKYRDKKKRKMISPSKYDINDAVSEYELFVKGIQDKIDEVFDYYQSYSRNRSDLSKFGMDVVQKALDKFKEQDWVKAYERYEQSGTMLKQYLDQALYYTNEISDHARAIVMVLKILDLNVEDFDFDEAENFTYDMGDVLSEYGTD